MTRSIVVRKRDELVGFFPAISQLFAECFDSSLSEELWQWLYTANPGGDPYVALALDGDRAVGHYGMISMPMADGDGKAVNSYLSITSMVAPSHRKHGFFAELGNLAYEDARKAGVDFVMGFPNKLAIPGRRKKLGWSMPPADYVAPLDLDELKALWSGPKGPFAGADLRAGLSDAAFREWRLKKPGVEYVSSSGLVYKSFGETIDLIYCESRDALDALPMGKRINTLLPASEEAYKERALFEYQYGGVGISQEFCADKVERQLIMSDVF